MQTSFWKSQDQAFSMLDVTTGMSNYCFHKKRYMNWRLYKSCHLIPMFIETPCIRRLFLTATCLSGSDAYQDEVLHACLAGWTIQEDFNDSILTLSGWLYTVYLNVFNFFTILHSHLNYHVKSDTPFNANILFPLKLIDRLKTSQ